MRGRSFSSPTTDEETETLRGEGLRRLVSGCVMWQTQVSQAHGWPGHLPKRFERPLISCKALLSPFMDTALWLWASVEQWVGWAWRLTGGCLGDGEGAGDRLAPTTNQTRAHLGKALRILQSHPQLSGHWMLPSSGGRRRGFFTILQKR